MKCIMIILADIAVSCSLISCGKEIKYDASGQIEVVQVSVLALERR